MSLFGILNVVNKNEILTMTVFDSTGTQTPDIATCVSTNFKYACGVHTTQFYSSSTGLITQDKYC